MSRPLKLRQNQVTAICKGAKAAGYVPVIEIDGAVVQLIPEDHAILVSRRRPAVDEDEDIRL
ncbi:hypothetical protein J2X35_001069 [Mesorhizobium sp. BE184]|nr:hypothetical protein [Mesorhizobium sp. BE184]